MVQLISLLSLDLDCLLLDEPFAGLDERACNYFVDGSKEKVRNKISNRHASARTSLWREQLPNKLLQQQLIIWQEEPHANKANKCSNLCFFDSYFDL